MPKKKTPTGAPTRYGTTRAEPTRRESRARLKKKEKIPHWQCGNRGIFTARRNLLGTNSPTLQKKAPRTSRMWRSVPQIPEYATLISTSSGLGFGTAAFFRVSVLLGASKLRNSMLRRCAVDDPHVAASPQRMRNPQPKTRGYKVTLHTRVCGAVCQLISLSLSLSAVILAYGQTAVSYYRATCVMCMRVCIWVRVRSRRSV